MNTEVPRVLFATVYCFLIFAILFPFFSASSPLIVGEIRALGAELKESAVVGRLFSAVPNRFMPIIGTIEQWGDTSMMSAAEAVGRLRVFEESLKRRQQHKEEDEKLMLTRSQWEAQEKEQLLLTRSQWEALALKERRSGEGSDSKEGGQKKDSEKKPYRPLCIRVQKTKEGKCKLHRERGRGASATDA